MFPQPDNPQSSLNTSNVPTVDVHAPLKIEENFQENEDKPEIARKEKTHFALGSLTLIVLITIIIILGILYFINLAGTGY